MAEKKQVEIENADVEIRFEPSEKHGLVAEGTYLSDAANRFGIFFEPLCVDAVHSCAVRVLQGSDLLSVPTREEIDNLSEESRVKGERLACQARIERAGEVVIDIPKEEEPQKDEEELKEERFQEFRKEFADLSLNQKVGKLMQLEAITLGETFSFVLNLPFTIGDQVMGVMAGFGKEMDKADREAKHPKGQSNGHADAQDAEEKQAESAESTESTQSEG